MQKFIERTKQLGMKVYLLDGALKIDDPHHELTDVIRDYIREHKQEIINTLQPSFAAMMELPDGREFWLAPDGYKFGSGSTPIIRRSTMDKIKSSGADVKLEVLRLVDDLYAFGGDLRILDKPPLKEARQTIYKAKGKV